MNTTQQGLAGNYFSTMFLSPSGQGMQSPDPEAGKSLGGSSQHRAQGVRIPPLEKRKLLDEQTHLLSLKRNGSLQKLLLALCVLHLPFPLNC